MFFSFSRLIPSAVTVGIAAFALTACSADPAPAPTSRPSSSVPVERGRLSGTAGDRPAILIDCFQGDVYLEAPDDAAADRLTEALADAVECSIDAEAEGVE